MTGTVLEEGLRGSGGWLTDSQGQRFMFDYDKRGERATRDIVSRSIMDRIRKGFASPHGGVYIEMAHLGPERVRREFKGMVERCADCGFDLAGGRVEVIPTAHYMMGGVVFDTDCTTPMRRLYAAGEDTGGVHGANRLGGNGVANSTVFGAIAGDTMAAYVRREGRLRDTDEASVAASIARHERPFAMPAASLEPVREALYACMWDDVGIARDADGLRRAQARLAGLDAELAHIGVADGDRAFNPSWHDWLNLASLIAVSRGIAAAALAREDSRGAHFREDFPEPGDLATSTFTVAQARGGDIAITREPVRFTRVKPGESLIAAD
jgi:fumarate reductase flavoprotein subunit